MVNYYRFIGEGPENDAYVQQFMQQANTVEKARKALTDEYGASGLLIQNGQPVGLGYSEKQNEKFLKWETTIQQGYYSYYPDRRTRKGKELYERLADSSLYFSISDTIIKTLNLSRWVFDEDRLYRESWAEIRNSHICVSIPVGDEDGGNDPMPEVPSWLKEVTESKWQDDCKQENKDE
jgi:hypothetical protein